jgi:hypothetical protein
MSLSSPIITSSMRAHFPKRTLSGVSNVETMSPPKQINFVNKKKQTTISLVYQVLVLNVQHLQNLRVQ